MQKSLFPLLFCSIAIVSSTASAEERTPDPPKTVYARKTVLDFGAVAVTGEVERPMADYIDAQKRARFRCMVKIRDSFRSEIEKSVEQL
jgi:hypothetical protein